LAKQINAPSVKNNIIKFAEYIGLQFVIQRSKKDYYVMAIPNSEFHFVYILSRLYPLSENFYEGLSRFGNEHDRSALRVKFDDDKPQYIIQASDIEMVKKTSLAETLPRMRNCLLTVVSQVEESVAQQKRLVGELFS
jgi:hypothetical protein